MSSHVKPSMSTCRNLSSVSLNMRPLLDTFPRKSIKIDKKSRCKPDTTGMQEINMNMPRANMRQAQDGMFAVKWGEF